MKMTPLALAACLTAAVPASAAPAAPAGIVLTCQGTGAHILRDSSGNKRTAYPIAFTLRVMSGSPVLEVMEARGTAIITPGRYAASFHGGSVIVAVPWTDPSRHPQTLMLTIDPKGAFSGTSPESLPERAQYLCSLLGDGCARMHVAVLDEVSGTCWGQ